MHCDRCGEIVEAGDEKAYNSETLCDDCYMDVLSPTRICDPWGVGLSLARLIATRLGGSMKIGGSDQGCQIILEVQVRVGSNFAG